MEPELKTLYWLSRSEGTSQVLGFVANDEHGGLVLKGPTGTHCTGHGESWRSKWAEIETSGFRVIDEPSWTAPRLSRKERTLLRLYTE